MKADKLAALLQKLQQEVRESAKTIRKLIKSAVKRARTDCLEELMYLDTKLTDPAIDFRGVHGEAALREGFEWARDCLTEEIDALAKPAGSVPEALEDARAAVLTVADELEDAAEFLVTAPIEEIQGK